jgi:uncharacterized protein YbjQ (UPF0145 family)
MPNCETLEVLGEGLSMTARTDAPYPHAVMHQFYDAATAAALLRWMEQDAPWVLDVRSFYVQYECHDLIMALDSGPTAPAVAPETLGVLRSEIERIFDTQLIAGRASVHAHKLVPGHAIGLHNDRPGRGVPSHRAIVHLSAGFDDSHGGHLVLLDRDDPERSTVIVRPLHNSAVLIEFSARSWHCVEEVRAGTRYSIIYSFWRDDEYTLPEGHVDVLRADEYAFLIEELRRRGADHVPHTHRSLLDHLTGTFDILASWDSDKDVCRAGLFHSVFGTTSFAGTLFADGEAAVRRLIGDRSLAYVRRFASLDTGALASLVTAAPASEAAQHERNAIVRLFWSNWLEQRVHADYRTQTEVERDRLLRLLDLTGSCLPAAVTQTLRSAIDGSAAAFRGSTSDKAS